MNVLEAIRKRRTIRKFKAGEVPIDVLKELVDLARLAPSAANLQPMEFILVTEPAARESLFEKLAFGAYVKPKRNPGPESRPGAYIVSLWNRKKSDFAQWEVGAGLQNILLGAVEKGLGACWLGGIDRDGIREQLSIPRDVDVLAVIAVGQADEEPVLEERDDTIKYWLDPKDVLHVPKRSLSSVLYMESYKISR
ncbi:MAG: nitroreductase family protein [Deltaproteobacteria bacterium]|nr:nitroreductase family protein [Deltaproteobacteria bacterium]